VLAAKAVSLGRACLYGLAAAGEAGVHYRIDILARELRMTMQLAGAPSIAELYGCFLRHLQPSPGHA
jgi:isopentenyl diphosphate isomerase/L-lactate dehydrogenase-like FMN-dependent dehydrogenase